VWARGITTTYSYDNGGSLATVVYSDGTTPNVTNTFDRLGRQSTIACGGMTNTMAYNTANQLLSETFTGGTLAGLAVTNAYDSYLRRIAVALSNQTSTVVQYGYDNASRLQNVTSGTAKVTYTYLANSPLVGQISFTNSGVQRMVTTKTYDLLNRLAATVSTPSAASAISYGYTYNSANQRVRVSLADGSAWQHVYDSVGQVVSGHKFFADGAPVAGQQFDYSFDNIGNRTQTLAGGDQGGLNQRVATYGANNLNQYTNRTVPGFADVMGISLATNSVTVGGQTAYRKGEYFRDQLPVSNSSAAVWTNIAVSSPNQNSITGNVFVAQSTENYSYDADGNQTGDGRWTFTWDGENRLVSMQGQSGIPTGAKYKLDFIYDSQSRRVQKLVSTNNGSSYMAQSTNRFIYDGWNLVAVLNPASSVMQSFVWGLDLSGSLQGAGGVGGLLVLNDAVNGPLFVTSDANGNVCMLTKATDGTIAAQYDYGPFGEVNRATGVMAKADPFRFSTKFQDDETELLYYGYRYHSASTGRWLSRDPIHETGGVNLYGFAHNNGVTYYDVLGQASVEITSKDGHVTKLDEPSNAQVRAAIAAFSEHTIVDFSVVGHGNQQQMYFNQQINGLFLNYLHDNRVEYDDDGSSFADSIRNKLALGAVIHFRGCNTAGARIWTWKKNISKQAAYELRGTYVWGSVIWRFGPAYPCGIYVGCKYGATIPMRYYYPPTK
jgi:RHS repeat-associated protein